MSDPEQRRDDRIRQIVNDLDLEEFIYSKLRELSGNPPFHSVCRDLAYAVVDRIEASDRNES